MTKSSRALAAAMAVAVAAITAGCGSEEAVGDPSDAQPPITGEDAIAEISGDLRLELVPVGAQPDGSIAVDAVLQTTSETVFEPRVDVVVPLGSMVEAGDLTGESITSVTGVGRCERINDTTWACYTDEFTVDMPITMELFVTPPAGRDGPIEVTGTALFDIGIENNEHDWSLRSDPDPSNNTVTISLE